MKVLACSLLALGLLGATPIYAAGLYVGPDGVGVDVRQNREYRDYDREDYRPYHRDDEGRSVYRDRNDREDQDQ